MQRVVVRLAPVEYQILGDRHLVLGDAVQRQNLAEMDDRRRQAAPQRMVEIGPN